MVGAAWMLGGTGANMVLRLGSNLALTRLLFPEAFGLMSLVNIVMAGLECLSDVGLQGSIVYHKRGGDPDFVNTAWTMQILRGFVLWIGSCLLVYPAAVFYSEPMLLKLLPVAGLAAVLNGFKSVKLLTCTRDVNLRRAVVVELFAFGSGIAVMVVWAFAYRTVWALVGGNLVIDGTRTLLSHLWMPGPRDRLRMDRSAVKPLIRYGKWVLFGTLTAFLASRLDRLMLGKLASMEILGVYSVAMVLAGVPQTIIQKLYVSVLQPVLASYARSSARAYEERLHLSQWVLLPASIAVCLGPALLGPAFFDCLYDRRYHDAGWMVQLLAIAMWFFILQTFLGRAELAVGHSRLNAASTFLNAVVTMFGCFLGFRVAGIAGLIIGSAAGNLAGYLLLEVAMYRRGIRTVAPHVTYTLIFLAISAVGGGLPRVLGRLEGRGYEVASTALISLPLFLIVGVWAVRRALVWMRGTGPSSAVGVSRA